MAHFFDTSGEKDLSNESTMLMGFLLLPQITKQNKKATKNNACAFHSTDNIILNFPDF